MKKLQTFGFGKPRSKDKLLNMIVILPQNHPSIHSNVAKIAMKHSDPKEPYYPACIHGTNGTFTYIFSLIFIGISCR